MIHVTRGTWQDAVNQELGVTVDKFRHAIDTHWKVTLPKYLSKDEVYQVAGLMLAISADGLKLAYGVLGQMSDMEEVVREAIRNGFSPLLFIPAADLPKRRIVCNHDLTDFYEWVEGSVEQYVEIHEALFRILSSLKTYQRELLLNCDKWGLATEGKG